MTICPQCLRHVDGSGHCSNCKRPVRAEDWAVTRDGFTFDPCDPQGLVAPADEGSVYSGRPLEPSATGCVNHVSGVYVTNAGGCRIGSHADITISDVPGLANVHAVLKKYGDLRGFKAGWWIFDCANDRLGTFVNRRRVVRGCHLQENDRIEVAGVAFRLENDTLHDAGRALSDAEPAIHVEDLSAEADGKKLLHGITFDVRQGEFVGIIGRSGCGKSSLVQRLAGFAELSGGRFSIKDPERTVFLPQNVETSLHDALTLEEEIASYCRVFAIAPDRTRTECVLKQLNLDDPARRKQRIGKFSGGEKRRVGIALALLRDPATLLLDEPCAGLDPSSAMSLMEHLYKLSANTGRTILLVTHILDNMNLFDRILVMKKDESGGVKDFYGEPDRLRSHYRCSDICEIYERLENGKEEVADARDWKTRLRGWVRGRPAVLAAAVRRLKGTLSPPRPRKALKDLRAAFDLPTFAPRLAGYLHRSWHELTWKTAAIYVLQPLLIALGLRYACAGLFREHANHVRVFGGEMLDFCAVLSMFWLGISNSVRDLVRERVPGRCLERRGGVPLAPYLASKYLWAALLAVAQTLLFWLFLRWSAGMGVALVDGGAPCGNSSLAIPFAAVPPLASSALVGAFVGLAISAVVEGDLVAVILVPNFAVLALLFSESVIGFGQNGLPYAPGAAWFARSIMPCHAATRALTGVFAGNSPVHALFAPAFAYTLCCFALSLAVVAFYQRRNERKWQGR